MTDILIKVVQLALIGVCCIVAAHIFIGVVMITLYVLTGVI